MSLTPHVVHIIYALGTGGLENGLVNIINRSPVGRYRHTIVCLTDATDFSKRITAPDVDVIELHKKPGQDWGLYGQLLKTLRQLSPDIVHTRNLASLEMQVVTLFLPGVKRVHGEHGRDMQDLDGTNKKYNLLRKALRPFIHRYIAVSEDLRGWLSRTIHVPEVKLRQIYNGVDTEKFQARQTVQVGDPTKTMEQQVLTPEGFLSSDTVVVGTVGRLAEVKNQRLLIMAIKCLMVARPELSHKVRLVMVGDGPLYSALQKEVLELGLSDVVWMPGDRDDVPQLMQLMDVFVLPSLAEGISNTVLEAMATGLPIVATKVGGNPELVVDGENGRLVSVGDEQKLAEVLAELIDNPNIRIQMGQNGLKRVTSTFNWQRTVSEYLGIYDELLGITPSNYTNNKVLEE
jgi:sugar transferase (PEP-CTERM/EpsH1 system associated)